MCSMCCVYMHMCVQRIFTCMCYMCMSIAVYILWMDVCICMHVCVLCDMCLHMLEGALCMYYMGVWCVYNMCSVCACAYVCEEVYV